MRRVLTLLVAVACGATACDAGAPATGASLCMDEVAASAQSASAPDRALFGVADEFPADATARARWDTLRASQRARRAAAWDVVARALAPVALGEPALAGKTVPRFRTWYGRDDVNRAFQHAYEGLGEEGRASRAALTPEALDDAFAWNARTLSRLPEWTAERWAAHVSAIDDPLDVAGLGGLERIVLSPAAARHVLESYGEIDACVSAGAPPDDSTAHPASATLVHEHLTLPACARRQLGPFSVARGGTLSVTFDAAVASRVRVFRGATLAMGEPLCAEAGAVGCTADGPGPLLVEIASGDGAVSGELTIAYAAPDVPAVGCLRGPFPLGATTVAQEWRRVELGPLPTYDTSASGLRAHLSAGAAATWGDGDGVAEPGPDEIFTMRAPGGGTFRLAGMHLRASELGKPLFVTLWWSPDPEHGFGADRPESIRALGGPWSHYVMCTALADTEADPDPRGGFDVDTPSLAEALAATHDPDGSFCSNPYIDAAPGLVRTNCVGCHQHAFTGVRAGETIGHERAYPANGRRYVRDRFPGDHFWGLDAGGNLADVIHETVRYFAPRAP